MKKLEAVDLSIVYAFPLIGNSFEGSRSHVVIRFFYFPVKKLEKKTPKIKEVYTVPHARCRRGAAKSGPLRGADLRFIYGLYIFYMRCGRPNYRLPARRGFRVRTGSTQAKDQTGLGGPNSLK